MNNSILRRLIGALVRYSEDGPRDTFTKQDVLDICFDDSDAARQSLHELVKFGGIELLGDFDQISRDQPIVRVFLEKLSALVIR